MDLILNLEFIFPDEMCFEQYEPERSLSVGTMIIQLLLFVSEIMQCFDICVKIITLLVLR